MPRINPVAHSRKPHTCGRCGDKIKIGDPYRWAKSRYGPKKVRCVKPECDFRPTDLSSAKSAVVYEAIDDARSTIETAEDHGTIQSALESVADTAQEIADEYQEASDNWAGGQGHEEFQEKSDTCSDFANELSGWQYSGEAEQGEMSDADWEEELQSMRDEACELLDGFGL